MKPARAVTRRYLPGSPFNVPQVVVPVEQYEVHDKVTHDAYGLGEVIGVEDEIALLIDFGTQRARIVTPCAKLTKL